MKFRKGSINFALLLALVLVFFPSQVLADVTISVPDRASPSEDIKCDLSSDMVLYFTWMEYDQNGDITNDYLFEELTKGESTLDSSYTREGYRYQCLVYSESQKNIPYVARNDPWAFSSLVDVDQDEYEMVILPDAIPAGEMATCQLVDPLTQATGMIGVINVYMNDKFVASSGSPVNSFSFNTSGYYGGDEITCKSTFNGVDGPFAKKRLDQPNGSLDLVLEKPIYENKNATCILNSDVLGGYKDIYFEWTVDGRRVKVDDVNKTPDVTRVVSSLDHENYYVGQYVQCRVFTDYDGSLLSGSLKISEPVKVLFGLYETPDLVFDSEFNAKENELFSVNLSDYVTDLDSAKEDLTFSLEGSSNYGAYIEDGFFKWIPSYEMSLGDVSKYEFDLRVEDEHNNVDLETMVVNVENTPVDFNIELLSLNSGADYYRNETIEMMLRFSRDGSKIVPDSVSVTLGNRTFSEVDGKYVLDLSTDLLPNVEEIQINATYDGKSVVKYVSVDILNMKPIVSFDYSPKEIFVGDRVSFVSDAKDLDGEIVSYKWDIYKVGLVTTANTSDFEYRFVEDGDYTVWLTVTDNDGTSVDVVKSLSVKQRPTDDNVAPVASFESNADLIYVGDLFEANSTSYDADGSIESFDWNLIASNGSVVASSTADTFSYVIFAKGNYTLNLTVMDNEGLNDSESLDFEVFNRPVVDNVAPVADFYFTPENPMIGDKVIFTANSTDPDGTFEDLKHNWKMFDLEDNLIRNVPGNVLEHTFIKEGIFIVQLTAVDLNGSQSVVNKSIEVTDEILESKIDANIPVVVEKIDLGNGQFRYIYRSKLRGFKLIEFVYQDFDETTVSLNLKNNVITVKGVPTEYDVYVPKIGIIDYVPEGFGCNVVFNKDLDMIDPDEMQEYENTYLEDGFCVAKSVDFDALFLNHIVVSKDLDVTSLLINEVRVSNNRIRFNLENPELTSNHARVSILNLATNSVMTFTQEIEPGRNLVDSVIRTRSGENFLRVSIFSNGNSRTFNVKG